MATSFGLEKPNTPDWNLYMAGQSYNQRLSPNLYDTVDANIDFMNGNQWRNLPETNMPKPVFNIIKRVINFFVASLTSSAVKIRYSQMFPDDPSIATSAGLKPSNVVEFVNKQVELLLEKFKMEFRVRDAAMDAAVTGDMAAHFYFDMTKKPYGNTSRYANIVGEICMELVDGVNIMFGNPNNACAEEQPYIIVIGRDMVSNLKRQAREYRKKQMSNAVQDGSNTSDPSMSDDPDMITPDVNYLYQAGWDAEIEITNVDEAGKALYIIVYRKVYDEATGDYQIYASKSVQSAYVFKDIPTGLTRYPVAWGNWEKQKNQYHGRAVCTGMLPNQIFINRMFAMVMYHLMLTAFPKAVYNQDYISEWNNQIGEAIGVSGLGGEVNIHNIAGYLPGSDISPNLFKIIELAMDFTKDMLGVTDAALGASDPKNTSATIAVQKASAIPLGNPRANLYEWVEDIGNILVDMMAAYYGERPVVMNQDVQTTNPMSGQPTTESQEVVQMFDFAQLREVALNTKVDVGEATYWSEITTQQTLDNLLANGHIDIIQYLERLPDEYLSMKEKLISELKARQEAAMAQQTAAMNAQTQAINDSQAQPPQAAQAPQQPAEPSLDDILSKLTPDERKRFEQAPDDVKQRLLQRMASAS